MLLSDVAPSLVLLLLRILDKVPEGDTRHIMCSRTVLPEVVEALDAAIVALPEDFWAPDATPFANYQKKAAPGGGLRSFVNAAACGGYALQAVFRSSTMSRASQVNSGRSRPKWP